MNSKFILPKAPIYPFMPFQFLDLLNCLMVPGTCLLSIIIIIITNSKITARFGRQTSAIPTAETHVRAAKLLTWQQMQLRAPSEQHGVHSGITVIVLMNCR